MTSSIKKQNPARGAGGEGRMALLLLILLDLKYQGGRREERSRRVGNAALVLRRGRESREKENPLPQE